MRCLHEINKLHTPPKHTQLLLLLVCSGILTVFILLILTCILPLHFQPKSMVLAAHLSSFARLKPLLAACTAVGEIG